MVLYKLKALLDFCLVLLYKSFGRQFFAENFKDIEIIVHSLKFKSQLEFLIWKLKVLKSQTDKVSLIHHLSNLDMLISSKYDSVVELKLLFHYDDLICFVNRDKANKPITLTDLMNDSHGQFLKILQILRQLTMKSINMIQSDLNLFFDLSSFLEKELLSYEEVKDYEAFCQSFHSLFRIIIRFKQFLSRLIQFKECKYLKPCLFKTLELISVNLVLFNKLSLNQRNYQFLLQTIRESTSKLIKSI